MENTQSIKVKASYFYSKQIVAHIKIKPTGSFDAYFISDLVDGLYYDIQKIDSFTGEHREKDKLFLVDIYDVKHFEKPIREVTK